MTRWLWFFFFYNNYFVCVSMLLYGCQRTTWWHSFSPPLCGFWGIKLILPHQAPWPAKPPFWALGVILVSVICHGFSSIQKTIMVSLVISYIDCFQYLTEVIREIKITFCCFDFFSLISSRAGVQKAIICGWSVDLVLKTPRLSLTSGV